LVWKELETDADDDGIEPSNETECEHRKAFAFSERSIASSDTCFKYILSIFRFLAVRVCKHHNLKLVPPVAETGEQRFAFRLLLGPLWTLKRIFLFSIDSHDNCAE
jgi:hypothetical protein